MATPTTSKTPPENKTPIKIHFTGTAMVLTAGAEALKESWIGSPPAQTTKDFKVIWRRGKQKNHSDNELKWDYNSL